MRLCDVGQFCSEKQTTMHDYVIADRDYRLPFEKQAPTCDCDWVAENVSGIRLIDIIFNFAVQPTMTIVPDEKHDHHRRQTYDVQKKLGHSY